VPDHFGSYQSVFGAFGVILSVEVSSSHSKSWSVHLHHSRTEWISAQICRIAFRIQTPDEDLLESFEALPPIAAFSNPWDSICAILGHLLALGYANDDLTVEQLLTGERFSCSEVRST
jgi:hypothetical protein